MATYHMTQIANSNLATTFATLPNDITKESFPFPVDGNSRCYQQFVVKLNNSKKFAADTSYVVRIGIPPDDNYNINFGVRLIKLPDSARDLRDYENYQLIKYISIPKYTNDSIEMNEVWFYSLDSGNIVNAAVAKPLEELPDPTDEDAAAQRANKFYYDDDEIYYYDNNGNIIEEVKNGVRISKNYYGKINKKSALFSNLFDNQQENQIPPVVREFIVTPDSAISGNIEYDALYFYLEPILEDSEIQWFDADNHNQLTYGRHINIEDVQITIYQLEDILDTNNLNDKIITNISVWGRSEQLMAIDGQEIKIGPSGYYELELDDYNLQSLCIANTVTAPPDKYTVDIQYKEQEES